MAKSMYNTALAYANDDRVVFVSHTIDPDRDSIPRLKAYSQKWGIKSQKWQFLTGNGDSILNLAEQSYFSTAYADSTAPGGFVHSGGLLLVDKNRAKGSFICFTVNFFSLRYKNNVLYQFHFLRKAEEDFLRISFTHAEKCKQLLSLISEEAGNAQKVHDNFLRSLLNILLCYIDRWILYKNQPEKASNKEEKIVQFEQLVEHNFVLHKNPSWYVNQLHIPANYLNKLCHDCRSMTSGELIRKRVITEAKRLLHYTSLSVPEIAYQLGFETPSYFITFFRKNTENTPENFWKKTG